MKNKKVLYLIAFSIFSLLTAGYILVIAVDFYYGYTPDYLVVLHVLVTIICLIAALINFRRYRKE